MEAVETVRCRRVLLLLSCLFAVVSHSAPPKATVKSLYDEKDDVISLRDDDFDYTVLATTNAWLVEFYNSWCGHCVRYAPIYKRLATNVKVWGPFMKVAAVDCSQDYNTELCQFYDIKMFPTLKFFPAFASRRTNGTSCLGADKILDLRNLMVAYISNSSLSNIEGRRFDLLQPVENLDELWQPSKHGYRPTVVIFEQELTTLGRQVILDMFGQTALVVRRMLARSASRYGVSKIPSMYLINSEDGSLKFLADGDSVTNYVAILKNLINSTMSDQGSPPQEPSESPGSLKSPGEISNNVREIIVGEETGPGKPAGSNQKSEILKRLKGVDLLGENYLTVHEQDLESSLHYSLRHEVAMFKTISGEKLLALKKYIDVLAKFHPVQKPISLFLNKVNNWLQIERGPITGDEWMKAIHRLQSPTEIFPEADTWTGCAGSDSKYRGYPCSLWTTFHTLTIAAYDRISEKFGKEDFDGVLVKEVLLAIRGYVKYFFGCRECSENFLKRSIHIEELVHSPGSGVLFLWKSHNRANYFLAGDLTEDPLHPKVQFPTAEQCPLCHRPDVAGGSESVFDEKEVLVFLQKMYTRRNLIPDSPRLSPGASERNFYGDDVDASFQQVHKRDDREFQGFDQSEKLVSRSSEIVRTRLKAFSLSGMGPVDIGMCVIFYVFCLGIVIIVYLRFVRLRSYRLCGNICRLPV